MFFLCGIILLGLINYTGGVFMERLSVLSSNVVSVGHDAQANVLEIEFRDNTVYRYKGVPAHVYISLLRADSHGQYIVSNIKGRYRQEKIA